MATLQILTETTETETPDQLMFRLKGSISTRYDISRISSPKLHTPLRGTKCIKILLSKASKGMHPPPIPMFFPPFYAKKGVAEFHYPDQIGKGICAKWCTQWPIRTCEKG